MTLSRILRAKMSVGSPRGSGALPRYLRITPQQCRPLKRAPCTPPKLSYLRKHHFLQNVSISPHYPNVVPAPAFQRRCFAHIIAKSYPIRTVIQLLSTGGLICPSISSHREGQNITISKNFFYLTSKIFDFMHSFLKKGKTKKPLHRHQKSAGALLSLQNDVLCNGFEIQRRDCCRTQTLANSTKTHRVVGDGIFS